VSDNKLKSFFMKHHVNESPTLDVPITNEIAERSLGRVEEMKQPKKIFGVSSYLHLSATEKRNLKEKANGFEKKFLSFVNNL